MQALEETRVPANVDEIVTGIRKHLDSTDSRSGYRGFLACQRRPHAPGKFWAHLLGFANARISLFPLTAATHYEFKLPSNEDALRSDWEMVGRDLYQAILENAIAAHSVEPTEGKHQIAVR
jgi:hypothetical protein